MKKLKFVIVTGMIAFAITACSSAPKSSPTQKPTAEITAEPTAEVTEEPTQEPTEEPTEEPTQEPVSQFKIGEIATLGNWEISITDMKIVDHIDISNYSSYTPDGSDKYIQVFASITNNGKKSDKFLPSYSFGDDVSVRLLYNTDYEYNSSILLGYDKDLHDSTLNPLTSIDGEIVFSVPEKITSSKEELLLVFFVGEDSVTFKIR